MYLHARCEMQVIFDKMFVILKNLQNHFSNGLGERNTLQNFVNIISKLRLI